MMMTRMMVEEQLYASSGLTALSQGIQYLIYIVIIHQVFPQQVSAALCAWLWPWLGSGRDWSAPGALA